MTMQAEDWAVALLILVALWTADGLYRLYRQAQEEAAKDRAREALKRLMDADKGVWRG